MQFFQFIEGFHENRHAVEKVVYSILDDLANVTLPNGAHRCRDYWCEWCSFAFHSSDGVAW